MLILVNTDLKKVQIKRNSPLLSLLSASFLRKNNSSAPDASAAKIDNAVSRAIPLVGCGLSFCANDLWSDDKAVHYTYQKELEKQKCP